MTSKLLWNLSITDRDHHSLFTQRLKTEAIHHPVIYSNCMHVIHFQMGKPRGISGLLYMWRKRFLLLRKEAAGEKPRQGQKARLIYLADRVRLPRGDYWL